MFSQILGQNFVLVVLQEPGNPGAAAARNIMLSSAPRSPPSFDRVSSTVDIGQAMPKENSPLVTPDPS